MLTPLKVLSLGFQKEMHDPVVAIKRIREFNWTMAKLQMLIDSSLEGGNGGRLTHLTKLFKDRLGQERLDTQIRAGEEGVNITESNPNPYIEKWYTNRVQRIIGAKPRNYPSKHRSVDSSTSSGQTVMYIDLESSDEEFDEF